MTFYKSSAFTKLYILLAVQGLVLIVLAFGGFYVPISAWVKTANTTSQLQSEEKALARKISEKALLETLDATLRTELDNIGGQLQSWHDQQTYLRELHTLTASKGLNLSNVKVSIREDYIQVEFEAEGEYKPLVEMCYQLEIHAMPVKIGSLRMDPFKSQVKARLQLFLWLLDHED